MEQEQKPQGRSFVRELVPDWRPTREQLLWAIRIAIVLVIVLGILTLIGLSFGITLWEWMKLLIVPAVIAAGGLWFNAQQSEREQKIANERAQDEALQAYLDQMSDLVIPTKDRPSLRDENPPDSLKSLARARTFTVLRRLDGERRDRILEFLDESGLITIDNVVLDLGGAALNEAHLVGSNLGKADLRRVGLRRAKLWSAKLREADLRWADLRWADLSGADLVHADLSGADLRGLVNLSGARFFGAKLSDAKLSGADLREAALSGVALDGTQLDHANLRGADLSYALLDRTNLSRADLRDANLSDHILSDPILSDAKGVTDELLLDVTASSLEGATMPNGQKYEDWLKDQEGSEEDGEND